MNELKLEVVRFDNEDVIATSLYMTLSNFGDGNTANGTFAFGSHSFTEGDLRNSYSDFRTAFADYFGVESSSAGGSHIKFNEQTLSTLIDATEDDPIGNALYNGIYTYTGDSKFSKQ